MMLPRRLGGVGIRDLSNMTKACLMKMGWHIRLGDEQSLWYKVIHGKDNRREIEDGRTVAKPTDSPFWKSVVRLWPCLSSWEA